MGDGTRAPKRGRTNMHDHSSSPRLAARDKSSLRIGEPGARVGKLIK